MQIELLEQVVLPADLSFKEVSQLCGDIGDQPNQNNFNTNIFINTKMQFQEMQGVGGAFSELGSKALFSLPEEKRQDVARELFWRNLTQFRLPIGASDFALSAYSLAETADDFAMEHFSIAHDEEYLLPYMSLAQSFCPEMQIHASPWSPPGWLKESGEMGGGSSIIDDAKYYAAYALYFERYIKAYAEKGFAIDRLNVQNEPDVDPQYPSCQMPPWQMAKFIKEYLHPHFAATGIDTEIFAGTFRTVNEATACEFLMADDDIADYISGIGCQYSVMQALYNIKMNFPQLKLMHTESNCFRGENTWEQAISLYTSIVHYMDAGCDTFTYWNMILNTCGESTWGWRQNSLVTIDEETGDVTYNPDYYVMRVAASCVQKGAKRILYACRSKAGIAFQNTDGSVSLMVSNFTENTQPTTLTIDGKVAELSLAPMSITSFRILQ